MSGLINKVKEAVHSDKKDNAATDNPQSSNAGPHGSNAANVADPRVDSDRDNTRSGQYGAPGATGATGAGIGSTGTTGAGYGSSTTGSGIGGNTGSGIGGTTGAGYGSSTTGGAHNDPRSGNAGPHSSNMANKADPRIDSDRDGRGLGHGAAGTQGTAYGSSTSGPGYGSSTTGAGVGSTGTSGAGYGSSGAGIGSTGTTGAGYGSTGTTGPGMGSTTTGAGYGDPRSTNAGPHSSNMANKADPRVDSDLDGGRSGGLGSSGVGHTGNTGAGYSSTGATGATGAGYGSNATPGSGNSNKTAGPHNSDMLNKLDPRVDSDMDGSKTMGGNATHR